MKSMKKLIALSLAAALLGLAGTAAAQNYPNRPIKLVYPFPAGGASDLTYRPVQEYLNKALGQPVILDARPGGGTMVASLYVKQQPADGYTIYAGSDTVAVKSVIPNAQIDIRKDFTPIAPSNLAPLVVLVNPDQVKATTLPELIAEAKANPGKLNYGSYGVGSGSHLFMAILCNDAKVDMVHVPYQGTAQAVQAAAAGQVQVTATIVSTARAFVTDFGGSGKLRMIGQSALDRSPLVPTAQSMREAGMPGTALELWGGYFGPPGMPKDIVDTLNKAINGALKDPQLIEIYKRFGITPIGGTPEELTKLVNNAYNNYSKLIKETGLKLE
jgi:tripartite-type tricarboxylate transporter receptor subunit TctC